MIGKRYPDKISNAKLFEKCKTYPISRQITELRWQKFGHIKIGSKCTSLHIYVHGSNPPNLGGT